MKRHVRISRGLPIVLLLSIISIGSAQHQVGVWEERNAPIPTKRQYYAASSVDGKIYAIGGYLWHDDEPKLGRVLRTVEEYDPATNEWTPKTGMRIARAGLSSSAVDGTSSAVDGIIYAIGGEVQMWWSRKHVEAYDPVADSWVRKADMLTARTRFTTIAADGKIYAMDHQSVEAYDPVADVWQESAASANQEKRPSRKRGRWCYLCHRRMGLGSTEIPSGCRSIRPGDRKMECQSRNASGTRRIHHERGRGQNLRDGRSRQ